MDLKNLSDVSQLLTPVLSLVLYTERERSKMTRTSVFAGVHVVVVGVVTEVVVVAVVVGVTDVVVVISVVDLTWMVAVKVLVAAVVHGQQYGSTS